MIKFQSLPRQKRQAIREEVLRLYAESDLSYGDIAEENVSGTRSKISARNCLHSPKWMS